MACEGRATGSGVSCRVRRPIWQPIGYPAAPTHPPHAIGTRGPLGDQITSIEASFDFSVQRPLKYPHVRPQMGNFATASRRESDPFSPTWSQGAQRNSLGPRGQNRRRTSGWELESQIRGHWHPRWMVPKSGICIFYLSSVRRGHKVHKIPILLGLESSDRAVRTDP